MNRRQFLGVAAGTSAASLIPKTTLFAESTTSFYVRGLVMLSFRDPEFLQIGFPKAHAHAATLRVFPLEGDEWSTELKGRGNLVGEFTGSKPEILLPELVSMTELYGQTVRPRIEKSPSLISIPWSAVQSVSTHSLSKSRYTFVRADTREEIHSFRPRRIAESLRIDILSSGTMNINDGKLTLPLNGVSELGTDFVPTRDGTGGFESHFQYYLPYVEGNDFDVVPKNLSPSKKSTRMAGNSFMMVLPWPTCFLVLL